MDRDVSPALLEAVQAAFREGIEESKRIAEIRQLIPDGKMTYALAQKYAAELGGVLSDAYLGQITHEMLPNGRMYYHIARDVLTPTLTEGYDMAAEAAMAAQMAINEGMQLSIRPVPPAAPTDRINGIIEKITGAGQFEDVQWVLKAPVVNLIQNAVDETVRANADFHAQAGLSPRIIRSTTGSSCPWCRQMAGVYDYPCDRDVYRRHDRCDCVVEYDPGDGRRQNAHTKIWTAETVNDKINIPYKKIKPASGEFAFGPVIRRSVGAWQVDNFDISNPLTGRRIKFIPGSRPIYPKDHLLAGKGSKKPIRKIEDLLEIGGKAEDWKHEKAYFDVYDDYGMEAYVEMHWFECEGVPGKIEKEIRIRDGECFFYDISEWERRWKR